jgi:hypothetical protein
MKIWNPSRFLVFSHLRGGRPYSIECVGSLQVGRSVPMASPWHLLPMQNLFVNVINRHHIIFKNRKFLWRSFRHIASVCPPSPWNTRIRKYGNTQILNLCYPLFRNTRIREYANTQIRKYANTQIRKYANTQIRKYANMQMLNLCYPLFSYKLVICLYCWCCCFFGTVYVCD